MAAIVQKPKYTNRIAKLADKYWLLVLIIIILISVGLRLYGITKSDIWHDEGFSVMLSANNWGNIWILSAKDVHPPLYYLILHSWRGLLGDSVLVLRSLSALSGVMVVGLGYAIAYKISKKRNAAALAGLLLAINPFLIRYSQEARMYGLLGVFLLLSVLGLIYIIEKRNSWLGYTLYAIGFCGALYTHYFSILAIGSLWLYAIYVSFYNPKLRKQNLLKDWRWWLANILPIILFASWIPNMVAQLSRGQGLGWLPKASVGTLNTTIWQFYTFSDGKLLWPAIFWVAPLALVAFVFYFSIKDESKYRFPIMLLMFAFIPTLLAITLSFIRPIFHERYFVFSAIGICILLGLALAKLFEKSKLAAVAATLLVILTSLFGIYNVNVQANHQISRTLELVNSNFESADTVVAGELYVYFDGSYYNQTPANLLLYTGQGRPNGFGESSLIESKGVYLDSYDQVNAKRVWLIGKTGQKSYYDNIPANWQLIDKVQDGYSEVRLYQIK